MPDNRLHFPTIDKQSLESYIEALPDGYDMPARLYFIENHHQKEIAAKLDLTLSQVKHKISKCKFLLKKMVNDPEIIKAKHILYGK